MDLIWADTKQDSRSDLLQIQGWIFQPQIFDEK